MYTCTPCREKDHTSKAFSSAHLHTHRRTRIPVRGWCPVPKMGTVGHLGTTLVCSVDEYSFTAQLSPLTDPEGIPPDSNSDSISVSVHVNEPLLALQFLVLTS